MPRPTITYMETRAAPHIRDGFNLDRALGLMLIAALPCLLWAVFNTGLQANLQLEITGLGKAPGWRGWFLAALGVNPDPASLTADLLHGMLYVTPLLAGLLAVGWAWQWLFARLRNRDMDPGLVLMALLFTLALPPGIALWQAALGFSFAIVIGREIFGGLGRNFLNPVLVGLAFLYVTYPGDLVGGIEWLQVDSISGATYYQETAGDAAKGISWGTSWLQTFFGLTPSSVGANSAFASLVAAAVLLYARLASARIMAGMLLGMIAAAALFNIFSSEDNIYSVVSWHWHFVIGSFAFGMVFLATDPVSAATTNQGRWIYGLLIGGLVVLIRVGNSAHPDGVIFAILIGNMFAPLIDYVVTSLHIRRRVRRYG
ncbi:MAG: RnfABCDGE type electron transport complex subunit D [Alphaproteobacteria bacterium]|nr:RnfABCDGE type electron transport complex subunit D [Alphaproteobacteria bacterium]